MGNEIGAQFNIKEQQNINLDSLFLEWPFKPFVYFSIIFFSLLFVEICYIF